MTQEHEPQSSNTVNSIELPPPTQTIRRADFTYQDAVTGTKIVDFPTIEGFAGLDPVVLELIRGMLQAQGLEDPNSIPHELLVKPGNNLQLGKAVKTGLAKRSFNGTPRNISISFHEPEGHAEYAQIQTTLTRTKITTPPARFIVDADLHSTGAGGKRVSHLQRDNILFFEGIKRIQGEEPYYAFQLRGADLNAELLETELKFSKNISGLQRYVNDANAVAFPIQGGNMSGKLTTPPLRIRGN